VCVCVFVLAGVKGVWCLLLWHQAIILWATGSCDDAEVRPRTNWGCLCLSVD